MRYLSLFSGIEAATVAWHKLGWEPIGFSEIEPFPCAVLQHHYPNVTNYGDITQHRIWSLPRDIDIIVGGSPCQAFSVAGKRGGLTDPRGRLMLDYLEVVERVRPTYVVWENVVGALSADNGRALGTFLGSLANLGYGWAYRVLDAQWVRTQWHPHAVPQRRRRVFVIGCLLERCAGNWTYPAALLFESESLRRDYPKGAKAKEGFAPGSARCFAGNCESGVAAALETTRHDYSRADGFNCVVGENEDTARCVTAGEGKRNDWETCTIITQPSWPADVSPTLNQSARGNGAPGYSDQELFAQGAGCLVPQPVPYDLFQITAPVNRQSRKPGDPCHTLARDNAAHAAVVNMQGSKSNACVSTDGSSFTLNAMHGHDVHAVTQAMSVRRLTPRECERLMGFPDDYTMIPWRKKPASDCPDSPRYRALGNSMAVNCMEWIGQRIHTHAHKD